MNKNKLYYEMRERNVTVSELCDAINMSRSAFYRKCNGKSEFTLSEARAIVEYLGLDDPMEIFLMKKCPKRYSM